jgi:hypothetical protein
LGATFRHELVELRLVFRSAQAQQKIPKPALLLFQSLQRGSPVFVEGLIAARSRLPRPIPMNICSGASMHS